jgi:hypothetical protein
VNPVFFGVYNRDGDYSVGAGGNVVDMGLVGIGHQTKYMQSSDWVT